MRTLRSTPRSAAVYDPTAGLGGLNPAWGAWLMGYPVAWVRCADSAMRSCPKWQQRS